jgi:adenosylcobyric acid synthase
LFVLNGHEEGMADGELRVGGTYLHNAFHNDAFRACWLNELRKNKGLPPRPVASDERGNVLGDRRGRGKPLVNEEAYEALAARLGEYLDVEAIMELAGVR